MQRTNLGRIKFIDLFSGIGGFRIAFERLGAECVFSSDIDKFSNQTYYDNFGEYPSGDIKQIRASMVPDHDVLCAGFPCQAFSVAGERKGFEDERGTLFFDVERILREKQPRAFILENVKGLINHDKGNTIRVIRARLKECGYDFFEKVLNTKDFGLPQHRERWLCAGFRKALEVTEFNFPKKKTLTKYVEDILEDKVKDHNVTETAWKNICTHHTAKKNGKHYHIVTEVRPSRCSIKNEGISPCLTAKMGTGGNNVPVIVELKRKYTTRECLRLMGFPESFKIKENNMQSYKQIGNSVPVPIICGMGKEVVRILNECR